MKYYAIYVERGKPTEKELEEFQALPFIKILNIVQRDTCIITFESEESINQDKVHLNKNWYVGKKIL